MRPWRRAVFLILFLFAWGCTLSPHPRSQASASAPVSCPTACPISAPSLSAGIPLSTGGVPSGRDADFLPHIAASTCGCPSQTRPPVLAEPVEFVGILPSRPVSQLAWNARGNCLALGVNNPDNYRVEVRCLPDFRLAGQWSVAGPILFGLFWTADDQGVLFIFDRGDASSIGLARLGHPVWQDLLPGEKAHLNVSLGKRFVAWLDGRTLAFAQGCGTGCASLHLLDIETGDLRSAARHGTDYLFSPDRHWLATNDWGSGFSRAAVEQWPGPGKKTCFLTLSIAYSEAQFWTGNSLAVVTYLSLTNPLGQQPSVRPVLSVWDPVTDQLSIRVEGAVRAFPGPSGDRVAVLFLGEPYNGQQMVETRGRFPYLGLLDWSSGRLLAAWPLGSEEIERIVDFWALPPPRWSLDGQWLVAPRYSGGALLLDREGSAWPILGDEIRWGWNESPWAGWGAQDHLALLVEHKVWLLRVPPAASDDCSE